MVKREHSETVLRNGLASFTFAKATSPHQEHPERNEDYLLIDRESGLAVACDGVGYVSGANLAARLAARTIKAHWRRLLASAYSTSQPLDLERALRQLLEKANQAVLALEKRVKKKQEQTDKEKIGAATTVALAVFYQRHEGYLMGYAHVGDSRIYLLRKEKALQRLTVDDGYFSWKMGKGEMNEEDAQRIDQASSADQLSEEDRAHFNKRNGIWQSLGDEQIVAHVGQIALCSGDRVLLCTDGIHDNLTDDEIETLLRKGARTTGAKNLVQCALVDSRRDEKVHIRAKKDDMSAIVISCHFCAEGKE